MDFSAAIGCGLFFCFLLFVCAFHFQRLRWKRNRRLGKKDLGFCPSFSSLGKSLQQLQLFAQPHVLMTIEDDATEKADAESEIPKDGVQHLRRQLRRIRNGDEIDSLTVLLKLWRS